VSAPDAERPSPYELWMQAGGNRGKYRALLLEHGLLIPLKPGEKREPLPCGWPDRRVTEADEDEGKVNDEFIPDRFESDWGYNTDAE